MNRRSASVMNWRNRRKLELIEYKGGKCEKCGYDKKISGAFHFHHKDPSVKEFGISGKSWSFDRLKAEVDKCSLLCANCHAETHWELLEDSRAERLVEVKREYLGDNDCEQCGKLYKVTHRDQRYCCNQCAKLAQRRVERPPLNQLLEDLKSASCLKVGKKYGVTDNTIRKWLKFYGSPRLGS